MIPIDRETNRSLREQQQKQYAEELRQQILEKERNSKSPNPYSTTSQDNAFAYSPPPPRRNNGMRSNAPFATTYSPTYNTRSEEKPNLKKEALPDFSRTAVAPLNLNMTNFVSESLPSLPRQYNSVSADISLYPERLRVLGQSVSSQKQSYQTALGSFEKIKSTLVPSVNQKVVELENHLEKVVSTYIPSSIHPINSNSSRNRSLLDTGSNSFNNLSQTVKDSLNEKTSTMAQFHSRMLDIADSTKTSFLEVKNEQGRNHDQQDLILQRVLKLENQQSSVLASLSLNNSNFESVDSKILGGFVLLQREINDTIMSISQQFALQLKKESEVSRSLEQDVQSQVEQVNQKYSSSVRLLQSSIKDITDSFSSSLTELSSSIGDGFSKTQIETDEILVGLSDGIDTMISDTEKNFSTIQTEIVSTIRDMKMSMNQIRSMLENTISSESAARSKNQKIIYDRFVHFNNIVGKEINIQQGKLRDICSILESNGKEYIKRMMNPVITDIEYLRAKGLELERIENGIEFLENQFKESQTQVFQGIASLQRTFQDISASYLDLKTGISNTFSSFNQSLFVLENNKREDIAMKEELTRNSQRTESILEDRIKSLENQLSMALSNLADLTIGQTEANNSENRGASTLMSMISDISGNQMVFKDDFIQDSKTDTNTM